MARRVPCGGERANLFNGQIIFNALKSPRHEKKQSAKNH
jgi:hypothetical protein